MILDKTVQNIIFAYYHNMLHLFMDLNQKACCLIDKQMLSNMNYQRFPILIECTCSSIALKKKDPLTQIFTMQNASHIHQCLNM